MKQSGRRVLDPLLARAQTAPEFPCHYCARKLPWGLLQEHDGELVCKNGASCQAAEDCPCVRYLANRRRRKREGDELTDAEAADLRAG